MAPHLSKPSVQAALNKLPQTIRKLFIVSLVNEVQEMLDDGNGSGERVSGLDWIKKRLLNANLARWRKEKPEYCVIDPDNRFTLGCSGHNSQVHGEKCTGVGWSTEKTREACGWDAPPPEQEMLPGIDYESIVAANDTFE